MKYYEAQNVGQPVAGCQFEKYEIVGGTAFGVYQTESEEDIAALDALIGKSSVHEITEAEYDRCLKKKPRSFDGSKLLNLPTLDSTSPGVPIKGKGAVVVEHNEPPAHIETPIEVSGQPATVADALRLEALPAPEGSATDPMSPPPQTREAFQNKRRRAK